MLGKTFLNIEKIHVSLKIKPKCGCDVIATKIIIAGVQQQSQLQNAQTLITEISEKCTTSCITYPGDTLSKTEQQCLARCSDRYMESWNLVSKILQNRLMSQEISEKCTTSCITYPGDTLSKTEQQCLARCSDRYMESWNLVSKILQNRLMSQVSSSHGDHSGFS
uniref:Mitochondrial import inner membrane translocase subunit n=1 Tax=Rhabditophanes sp. KR3021 TaxID=114890 RepID=A0AC35THH8_9BILA